MRKAGTLAVIALLAPLAACQTAPTSSPTWRYDCTYRPEEAGFCEKPSNFNLFQYIVSER